jgi:peroxiredoxin-like protein
MKGKTTKQLFFNVDLKWLADTQGELKAHDAEGVLYVATPPAFGGTGKPWSPEHFFLSAISSCFMATLLAFARKLQFNITAFSCESIGQVEIVDGRYQFTTVNLYPRITVATADLKEKAMRAVEKTHKNCLVTNSINSQVFYHTSIIVADDPMTEDIPGLVFRA